MSNLEDLNDAAKALGLSLNDSEFAAHLDANDPLAYLRSEFHIPTHGSLPPRCGNPGTPDEPCVYLCGNSLGLQPRGTAQLVTEELTKWARRGVHGHFDDSARPWVSIDECVVGLSAAVVGALPSEIAVMNSLTVNLHVLLTAFYTPTATRHKIVLEAKAFPSDYYAVVSQLRLKGLDPATSLVELTPRSGEYCLREADILAVLEEHGDSVALLLCPGVQFYTGQLFDIPLLTAAAQAKGCVVGLDLAHAVGNVDLRLHDWGVDFACWCTYKYLNAGPGGIAGAFVHDKHAAAILSMPRLAGWWGVDPATRFRMDYDGAFLPGVKALQLSNPPVLQTVCLLGSLRVFALTSMPALRAKSLRLTGYLEQLLAQLAAAAPATLSLITPTEPHRRGCQLSLLFAQNILPIFHFLEQHGVVCDKREPNVLRIAPAPLYNSFSDVHR